MKKIFAKNSGFTIIELMTVIVIIATVTVITAASYHQGKSQKVLDGQAYQLKQDLRQAQEWALSAYEIDGTPSYGYGIYIRQGNDSYILYSDDNNNKQYDSGFDRENRVVALNEKIEITSCVSGGANISSGISINYIAPDLTAKIIDGGGGDHETLEINFGVINGDGIRTVVANIAGLVYVK